MESIGCLFKLTWDRTGSPTSPDLSGELDPPPSVVSAVALPRLPSSSTPSAAPAASENLSASPADPLMPDSFSTASLPCVRSAVAAKPSGEETSREDVALVPRGYQLELFQRACTENIIAFLDTGAGKTLISALLVRKTLEDLEALARSKTAEVELVENDRSDDVSRDRTRGCEKAPVSRTTVSPVSPMQVDDPPPFSGSLATSIFCFGRDASPMLETDKIAVFLVHRVPLVPQQAEVMRSVMPSHIQVGSYYGEKGVDDWSSSKWASSLRTKKVLVMTAQIFLNLLRHGLLDIRNVALLVLDEVHHATKNHPYRRLFIEFYHTLKKSEPHPRVFGMTATPVKAKAASQQEGPCLSAIVALETTLDSTVVSVSDEALVEVEELVPRPEEYVVTYEGSSMTMDIDKDETAALETNTLGKLLEIVAEGQVNSASGGETVGFVNMPKPSGNDPEEEKMLKFLCWKVGYRAASHFASRLWTAQGLSASPFMAHLRSECGNKDLENGGIPDKVSKLLGVLFAECMRSKEEGTGVVSTSSTTDLFRSIIFVNERVTAVALAWLISEVFKGLERTELMAQSALGAQNSSSFVRMSLPKLLETIEDFRTGIFGVLVATNVVEEGIDVPACRLVVAFDPVLSPTAYVQGKGRARKRGARYIALIQEDSAEQYNAMFYAREGAKMMNQVANDGAATDAERKLHKQKLLEEAFTKEKTLYSRTTRARATATEALNLLHRYSKMKSSCLNEGEAVRPDYTVDQLCPGQYTAQVKLHPQIPIDYGLCDIPQESSIQARRYAALDAYSKLYQVGEVDEFLLPRRSPRAKKILRVYHPAELDGNGDRSLPLGEKSNRAKASKLSKKDKKLRECRILHPSPLQSSPPRIPNDCTDTGHETEEITRDQAGVHVDDSVAHTADTCSDKSTGQNVFLYSIRLDHSTKCFGFYSNDRNLMLGLLTKHKVPNEDLKALRCPSGEKLLTLTYEKSIPWSGSEQSKAYAYVRNIQLCLRGKCPGSPAALGIAAAHYSESAATGFVLVPLRCPEGPASVDIDWPSIEKLLSFGWRIGPPEEHDYRCSSRMENVLVCSYHEELDRVYLTGSYSARFVANSHHDGLLNTSYCSFADYFERRHGTALQNNEQRMLEGFPLLEKLCWQSTSTFMLAPETCRIIPLPPMVCYVASILPRWQTFLALRACWRLNAISTDMTTFIAFARALQPNVDNVAKAGADLSYERLEFLGDAVLKVIFSMAAFIMNPNDNEGILSDERDVEVSNQKLADIAIAMKIHDCVAFSGVSQKAKAWPWFWGTHQNKSIQVSEKVLADCVEALLGVQYLEGGINLAAAFMDKHNLLPGVCKVLGISKGSDPGRSLVVKAPTQSLNDTRATSPFIHEVEGKIGYSFVDKVHLVTALTHGSYRNGRCHSYQRYEYLGDAIIGFVLLAHFFHKYPDLSPGDLTTLRGPALSNDLFARVIVSLGIHDLFWLDCTPLNVEMKKFEDLVANEENDDDDVCKTMTVPKVLGDLLESIIGSIVVDKGMRLDGIRDILLRLMNVELERFANPEKFKHNPVTDLVHIVQKTHSVLPEYKYHDDPNGSFKMCSIIVKGNKIGYGEGPTRRIAKHRAALSGLEEVKKENSLHGVGSEV